MELRLGYKVIFVMFQKTNLDQSHSVSRSLKLSTLTFKLYNNIFKCHGVTFGIAQNVSWCDTFMIL